MKVTLVAALLATSITTFAPAGTIPGKLRFSLQNSGGTDVAGSPQDIDDSGMVSPQAVFTAVADGSYMGIVQRLTDGGANLGNPLSVPVSVLTPAAVSDPDPSGAPAAVVPATFYAPSSLSALVEVE